MVVVRPFRLDDLDQVVAVQNADPVMYKLSADELRRDFETLPEHLAHRILVAEVSGAVVGWADAQHDAGSYDPKKLHMELYVHPEHRRLGVGTPLFDGVLALAVGLQVDSLRVQVRENDRDSVAFATKRGFVTTKKDFVSDLDVAAFDWSEPCADVEIVALTESDSPDFRRAWHEAFSEIRLDTPRSAPASPISFDFFDEHVAGDAELIREATLFALDKGQIVGFTGAFRSAEDGVADQWLTGVQRSHRVQGVALALKVACVRALQVLGFQRLQTDNDTTNAPMLAVNEKLGFVRRPAVLSMLLELSKQPD